MPEISRDKFLARGRAKQDALRRARGDLTMVAYRAKRRAAKEARLSRLAAERVVKAEKRCAAVAANRAAVKRRELARSTAWRLANPEHSRALQKVWRGANREKRRVEKRARKVEKRTELRAYLTRAQRGRCAVCADRLAADAHLDHIMPRKLGGSNDRSNFQLTCPPCNLTKGARHPIDHARSLGRLL